MRPEPDEVAVARRALEVLAVDPTLGLRLRGPAGPARDAWLEGLRGSLPEHAPWRRMPLGCSPERLAGGFDLLASLQSGRMVASPGLLVEAAGGILLLASAERMERGAAAILAQALDDGPAAGDTGANASPRAGLVVLDEGYGDETPPESLLDRLAIGLDLAGSRTLDVPATRRDARAIVAARARVARVTVPRAAIEAICTAALAFGIASLRPPRHAVRVARIAAALAGRRRVGQEDVALAARLCLGPRARVLPAAEPMPSEESHPPGTEAPGEREASSSRSEGDPSQDLERIAVVAARAGVPDALLDRTSGRPSVRRSAKGSAGRRGSASTAARGRPIGSRRGHPDGGTDLDLAATLFAAVPWQMARGRVPGERLRLRAEDVRVVRRRAPQRATTVFAVDASGSAAHGRLAEAKGAVELLLAECYVRRDEVALVAFRGAEADLLLAPTRSLARAKRELAELPGGGGTPLAAGLDLALAVARQALRDGRDPLIAVLTDGRGNIGRGGVADRARAEADGLAAAADIRAAGLAALVIDVSPRPNPAAARLAEAMAARYVPLPRGGAEAIAGAVLPAGGNAR
ncbi:MAG: magnesium chelatase subunit D [Parafilimonas terrae]|nr:magnesium chelatase subunit D [Parafilimonas terrae]